MKKMRHMKRNALVALVLSVTMLLTLMPGLVFGVSDDQGDPDTVSSSIDYPTVNFTDVAPFLPPVSGAAPRRSPARAAGDANTGSDNGNNGMAVNKTSVYNEDTGAYTYRYVIIGLLLNGQVFGELWDAARHSRGES